MPERLLPKARSSVRVIKQRVAGTKVKPPEEDFLAIEDPLEILLAYEQDSRPVEKKLIVTMRTPGHDRELIHGFLYCEGIIKNPAEIINIQFNAEKTTAAPTQARVQLGKGIDLSEKTCERNFAVHSSCGVCGTTSIGHLKIPKSLKINDTTSVPADWIHILPERMRDEQDTFSQTGGLHAAAIFSSDKKLLASHEDIGRHNALDKAIGSNLIAGLTPACGQVLCVSGRMSYEILQKALIARIPIILGVGAPSSLAVALANDFSITLIGFVRNGSYNIYSCPERISSKT